MAVREYVIDEEQYEWENPRGRPDRASGEFPVKYLSDGREGRPSAVIGYQPEGFENPAHFHSEQQFQVILAGTVQFPGHELKSVAVHFSDANSPYGPFFVGKDFKIAVLRSREAQQIYMSDREGRKLRNSFGRELYGQSADGPWTPVDGQPGIERQLLFDAESGPTAEILRAGAGAAIGFGAAEHGAFHVVVAGRAEVSGGEIGLHSMRYVQGDEVPTPMTAAEDGTEILVLTFGEG